MFNLIFNSLILIIFIMKKTQFLSKKTQFLSVILVSLFLFTACSNDDEGVVNEEEVITTLIATFVPQDGGETVVLNYKNLDGTPIFTPLVGVFQTNKVYNGSLQLFNELTSPADNITEEIELEGSKHQFFFSITNSLGSFEYNDFDVNGKPLGLEFTFSTQTTLGTGNMIIVLRHEPNKSAEGVSQGIIDNAGGETDIEIVFPVQVQ
jgi:hypothetical protein